jgi:hypothetical protein
LNGRPSKRKGEKMGTKKGNRRKGAVAGARLGYDAVPKKKRKRPKRLGVRRRGRGFVKAPYRIPQREIRLFAYLKNMFKF